MSKLKFKPNYYVVSYMHTLYGHTEPTLQHAVYFQLESAQEAMMKMIKRGQEVVELKEKKLVASPQILGIVRKGTP